MTLLRWLFGLAPGTTSKIEGKQRAVANLTLAKGRGYTFDIVGESRYQDVLDNIAGGKSKRGHKIEVLATLVLDDDNPHDQKAVRVEISGATVGFVPRNKCRDIRSAIAALDQGAMAATCSAKIVGGWSDDAGEGHYGVKLSISAPVRRAT